MKNAVFKFFAGGHFNVAHSSADAGFGVANDACRSDIADNGEHTFEFRGVDRSG